MSVANLLPGDDIDVEIDWTETIPTVDSTYEFVFPTVVGPRYTGGSAAAMALAAIHRLSWRETASSGLFAIAAVLAPILTLGTPRPPVPPDFVQGPAVFTFDGLLLPLHPLPASEAETAFAQSFPCTLASYQWGHDQVILRRVNEVTRRLHPSRDCLRAAGFETTESITVTLGDGTQWARFAATRDGIRRTVHERITSGRDGAAWTDVSAWYWSALRHPLHGPWQAETVISAS